MILRNYVLNHKLVSSTCDLLLLLLLLLLLGPS